MMAMVNTRFEAIERRLMQLEARLVDLEHKGSVPQGGDSGEPETLAPTKTRKTKEAK